MRKSGAKRGAQATVSEHRLMHLTAARARCELRARFWHLLCTHLCQPMLRRLGRRLGLACRDLEGPQQLDWLCDGGPDSDSAMVEWRLGGGLNTCGSIVSERACVRRGVAQGWGGIRPPTVTFRSVGS